MTHAFISRSEKILGKSDPKNLDLYASIYGSFLPDNKRIAVWPLLIWCRTWRLRGPLPMRNLTFLEAKKTLRETSETILPPLKLEGLYVKSEMNKINRHRKLFNNLRWKKAFRKCLIWMYDFIFHGQNIMIGTSIYQCIDFVQPYLIYRQMIDWTSKNWMRKVWPIWNGW